MWRSRARRVGVVAAAVALTAVPLAGASQVGAPRGGTYRVGWDSMVFDNMDPLGAWPDSYGLLTNLLVRTLVQYDHVSGAAGSRLVADLAERVPAPTNDGRTYTFRLKRGVKFGPPVNRSITSADVRYAFERLARPRNAALYPYHFDVIRGFDAYRRGAAATIAGIATPDPRTVRFDLKHPVGDFLHRLTLPAAAPVPREVARCFEGKPRRYGSDLVSSGPYMIAGADAVDARSCSTISRMRGISNDQLTLVRNPLYDARTDSREARESNPDRFVFVGVHAGGARTPVQLVKQVEAGELDDAILYAAPKVVTPFAQRAKADGRFRVTLAYWRFYVSMNLTRPPFDDVHVRKALSWVLNRAAIRDVAGGGPLVGAIPEHLVPDELLGGRLKDFAPFATPGGRGSVARARAEMSKSKYATRNGVCTARACKHVFFAPLFNCSCYSIGTRTGAILAADAAKIGITFANHARDFDKFLTPSKNIPLAPNAEWLSDYLDPAGFLEREFGAGAITPSLNWNTSLVGITPAQARRLGVEGRVGRVPSVDADLARCRPLTGNRRLDCYAALDRKLSAEIVPWIPLLWRSRVTVVGRQVARWAFDQSAGMTSFAHVAIKR